MPLSFPLALFAAFIFYAALPLLGAFIVRSRWRIFRRLLNKIKTSPVFSGANTTDFTPTLIYGTIEGIQGNDKLWIRSFGRSIQVHAEKSRIYELAEDQQEEAKQQMPVPPVMLRWNHVGPLPESSPVLVWGNLGLQNGLLVLQGTNEATPLIVFYEGDESTVLKRLIWSGRQRNEYWNAFTPVSFILGFAVMAIFIFTSVRESPNRLWALILATVSFLPFAILFPPGIAGFFTYRFLWRKGRICRAQRDMYAFSGETGRIAELLQKKARHLEWAALIIFVVSLLINSFLVFLLMAQLAAVR